MTISGFTDLRESDVLSLAGITPKKSLPFFDVAAARANLEAAPLVKQASVRKLYPDQIVIDIVERTPAALWQKDGEVSAIAADGAVIDELRDTRSLRSALRGRRRRQRAARRVSFPARRRAGAAPEDRRRRLVGERRWNLKMKSGVDVKLPETDPLSAVATLVALQRQSRILERDILWLDLRTPGRVFARLSDEAAAARAEARAQEGRRAMTFKPLTPRMRQMPPHKSAVLSVLDVGASKIVCLIARLTPMERSEALRGRTHRCKVLGIGHQRSRGVKAGAIVDLDAAENAIRLAIDAAERMSGVEVDSVIVNMSGGRLSSQLFAAKIAARQGGRRIRRASRARGRLGGERVRRAAPSCMPCRPDFWLDAPARRPRSQGHGRRRTRRRTARGVLRRRGGAQSDAGDRTLPPAGRGDGRHALRRRPVDAGRRRGRTRRGAGRFRRRLDHGRRLRRRPARPSSTRSRSAAITSRWTSRAASPSASPTPSV